ncbi:MAG: hypothetical protein WAU33_06305 [Candidatus Binataceae bacterium]
MKRYLYMLITVIGMTAIIVAAMVCGAIAQTLGEYGATTASAGTGTGVTSQGSMDSQVPETVWAGATKFPESDQLSDKSSFPESERFSSASTLDNESSDRFSSADQFPQASALDSSADRFETPDRWSQDSWGK